MTPDKEIVWKYVNPGEGRLQPRRLRRPGGPPPNQVLPVFLQDMLDLSAEQKKELDALQKTVDATLDKTLTDAQKKTLREPEPPGPGGFAAMPAPGQIISVSTQVTLKPTPEQKAQLADMQKEVDAGLDKVLTADQKKQLKEMRADFLRGGPPGGPGGGRRAVRRPGGGPPPLSGGPPGGSAVFRAYRYGPDYPGLAGKDLKPGKTVEELQPQGAGGKTQGAPARRPKESAKK